MLIEVGEDAFKAAGGGDLCAGKVGPIHPLDLVLCKQWIDRERDLFGDFAEFSAALLGCVDEKAPCVHQEPLAAKVLNELFE